MYFKAIRKEPTRWRDTSLPAVLDSLARILADFLINKGEAVTILDNLSTGRFANIRHLEGNEHFKCIIEDVSNDRITEELIREADFVHHLAASVGVRVVIERPTHAIINNVLGTVDSFRETPADIESPY